VSERKIDYISVGAKSYYYGCFEERLKFYINKDNYSSKAMKHWWGIVSITLCRLYLGENIQYT
jgi:hypothetical protein